MSRPTHVYALSGPKWSKVGVSNNPEFRAKYIAAGDLRIKLVQTWHRPNDAFTVEFAVRDALRPHRHYPGTFECFNVSVDTLVDHVEIAIKQVDAGTHVRSPAVFARERTIQLRAERAAKMAAIHKLVFGD